MNITRSNIAFLGLGVSGLSALSFIQPRALSVKAWDDRSEVRKTISADILCAFDQDAHLQGCAALVAAPGIADDHPILQRARRLGVDIICDIELWHRLYPQAQTIGITGTNGKSTLTAMVRHILDMHGLTVHMGGNIGTPIFDLPPPKEDHIYVLELSSFQIERCPTFRPFIAALLNITPDHLDRHGTMESYAAIKARIFEGAGQGVIATDDPWTRDIAQMVDAARMRTLVRVHDSASPATQNQRMALEIASLLKVNKTHALGALESFKPLPHRQNIVMAQGDLTYVNDSKATNAQAARSALHSFEDIIWIVGGALKEGGLHDLRFDLGHVRHACVIGADTQPLIGWLRDHKISYTDCGTMDKAVQTAHKLAAELDKAKTILLSPACASYDQYDNFMQRGDHFIECVKSFQLG